jgi:transcriptional regulator with XRE-family HTH domain
MAKRESYSFGRAVVQRRRQLGMTQEELAGRIKTSSTYITFLESGKRHPSNKLIIKLAQVLLLDRRELFLLANPGTKGILSQEVQSKRGSAWQKFAKNHNLRKIHSITKAETQILSHVAAMGEVRCQRDFLFILNSIRQALGR